jgi:ferredoxin-NADP reductase
MDHETMRRFHGKPSGFQKITHRIALISKTQVARDTVLFRFEKPAGFSYRAGQHVRMSLLDPRRPELAMAYRFWSFASAPSEPELTFAIRMRMSPFKTELAELPIGGRVQIDMLRTTPHGAFALDDAATPVVFLTGGIGVVPAWSMIKQALHDGTSRRLTLFYANRTDKDAPFLAELSALADRHANFDFVPTLTQADEAEPRFAERGRISVEMMARHVPDLKTPLFYISGLRGMVETLNVMLVAAGVSKTAIRSEAFGNFAAARPANKKGAASTLSLLGLVILAATVLALHSAPLWFMTNNRPLEWLMSHPLSCSAAVLFALIILIKISFFITLRRKGDHLR